MKMKDGMLLFHGSYSAVEKIDLSMSMEGKDFGSGFYLTSSVTQAKGFIRTSVLKAQRMGNAASDQNYGYVSSFRYVEDGLKIFEFKDTDREWLWFIAQNRRPYLADMLTDKVNPDAFRADVVIGKVANDKTNPTITAYLNGLYEDILSDRAVRFAIEELLPNQLEDQFCFRTEQAVACLDFQEARKYVI